MKIEHKVFVVTGGGNGMGRQVVLELVRRGAIVAAVDLNKPGLEETVQLAGSGARVTAHMADVTDRAAVEELVATIVRDHGHVDGLINIAGIIHRFIEFDELSVDEAERVINVNFWGTVNVTRAVLPVLRARPEAVLVNMASLAALVPFAGQTLYGASKGAVKQFTEGLHAELIDSKIAVSAIFPGHIATNLTGNSGVAMIDSKGKKARTTTPEAAGRAIVDGLARGRFRILVGRDAVMLDKLERLAPRWTTRMVARQMKSVL